jgi:DHA2 family methylenomycin A resistance protein-like MFS transporter
MFFMAQYFQAVQGGSALDAGLRLLPLTLGIFIVSPPAGRIAGRVGPRPPVAIGAVLTMIGFFLLSTITATSSFGSVWWKLGLVGIGIGFMFAPLTVAVMAAVPPARAGLGSSMINTSRIVGFTAGAAILGTTLVGKFTGNISSELTERGVPSGASEAVAGQIAHSGAYANQIPLSGRLPLAQPQITEAINNAFVSATHAVYLICAACMLVAAIAVASLLRGKRPPAPGAPAGPAAGSEGSPAKPAPQVARSR